MKDYPIYLFRRSAVDDLERSRFPDNHEPGSVHYVYCPPGTGAHLDICAPLHTCATGKEMLWIQCLEQSFGDGAKAGAYTDVIGAVEVFADPVNGRTNRQSIQSVAHAIPLLS